jgi:hypothetical protein
MAIPNLTPRFKTINGSRYTHYQTGDKAEMQDLAARLEKKGYTAKAICVKQWVYNGKRQSVWAVYYKAK